MPELVLNPLDWTAELFLTLYWGMALAVLLAVYLGRRRLGAAPPPQPARGLGLLQIAFLAGGPERVADTALVALFEAGAASLGRWRMRVLLDHAATVPHQFRPFLAALPAKASRREVRAAALEEAEQVRAGLVRDGLVASDRTVARFHALALGLLVVPVALGTAKIVVGGHRGHPVGILVTLVFATALFGLAMALRRPFHTRTGTAALAQLRENYGRAARAPLDHEVPLAFALAGQAVLAGRDYQAWFRNAGSGSGDGSSGGGDGGGGGCGGCGS